MKLKLRPKRKKRNLRGNKKVVFFNTLRLMNSDFEEITFDEYHLM
jgi:hypothetical protein